MTELWPESEYARRIAAGELAYQRCGECGAAVFFPRVLCPSCGSTRLAWEAGSGRGTVYSATTLHSRSSDPYTIALVDLEEGYRMMTRIEGEASAGSPIGLPVQVTPTEIDGRPATTATLTGGADDE